MTLGAGEGAPAGTTGARRPTPRPALLREIILLVTLFVAYRLGRLAITGHDDLAIANAWRVWDVERLLRLPDEETLAGLGRCSGPTCSRPRTGTTSASTSR